MQVILREDYPSLGFVGDVVKVKPGFARNFLFPKKIALLANPRNVAQFEHHKRLLEVKKKEKEKEAIQLKQRLEGVHLVIQHASEGDRLFGSVTSTELQARLKENGFEMDRKLLRLEAPIRSLGDYFFEVKLHQSVSARLKVTVEPLVSEANKDAAPKESPQEGTKKPRRKKEVPVPSPSEDVATETEE